MGRAHVSTHELVAERYRLVEMVHRETNRVCWRAEDVTAGHRPCLVVQTWLPDDPDGETGRRLAARVIRTSETMHLLCPGRVAAVLDAVAEYGALWTVTERPRGTPLGELLSRQGAFNYARAARIGLELLDVLDAAHGEGITHGELSPGQVFVGAEGSVVLTGFGLVGATLLPRVAAPSYASPEQARDERVGPAADLWALGALLYTMVEGRPPFRDRGRPEATLKAVDRLPPRSPLRAGPLTQVVQGLLRKDSRERLPRPVVREALTRVRHEDTGPAPRPAPSPRLRGGYAAIRGAGRARSRRTMVTGTALAVVTVAVAVVAATHGLPGTGGSQQGAQPRPSAEATGPRPGPTAPAAPPGDEADDRPARPPATSPRPTTPAGPPGGFRTYRAPEGFSLALPKGWRPISTTRVSGVAYRVVLGAADDPRTLAVTYSERVGPDPVAVWRDDVEPGLRNTGDYRRIGDIRATSYQGYEAADIQWLAGDDGDRVRTFGRGFLIGGGRGFSLRWTTPAADWADAANRRVLDTVLRTFRPPSD